VQGWKRRVVYVGLYEVIGMLIASIVLGLLSGAKAVQSGLLSVMLTSTALTVNFIYNYLFEKWERRQSARTRRTLRRRLIHAIGFQFSLVIFLIPLIAWWLEVSLLKAFLMDLVLIIFFPIFTFFYNWVFDLVFGLPDAVTEAAG